MRGEVEEQGELWYVGSAEDLVPQEHPLRPIKRLADAELKRLSPVFDGMYKITGRPSVPPERLLKGCLLIALFSLRGENHLCEQLNYNFLFRWFLDMQPSERPWNSSTFAKNKERLLKADVARRFFEAIVTQARGAKLLSHEHFTVDGTLIDAWASQKSFRKKDGPAEPPASGESDGRNSDVDFKGEKRSNETHQSTTDPEARLMRKGFGKEAKLCFGVHVLMENRNGLCVDIATAQATGTFECEQALLQVRRQKARGVPIKTVGADKGYDQHRFVEGLREAGVTPHVAAKDKCSVLDQRTTRHAGYRVSQRIRKRVEEIFGWMKTVGGFRKTRYKGVTRTGLWAYFVASAYNLVRLSKLLTA